MAGDESAMNSAQSMSSSAPPDSSLDFHAYEGARGICSLYGIGGLCSGFATPGIPTGLFIEMPGNSTRSRKAAKKVMSARHNARKPTPPAATGAMVAFPDAFFKGGEEGDLTIHRSASPV